MSSSARVLAVARHAAHEFSKEPTCEIVLLEGLGVEGDAHCGATVRHRSRVVRDPTQPNLRQVHLLHAELLDELAAAGFSVKPGGLGENVTTASIDLLALPAGTELRLGARAIVRVTGLRNPCAQIERFRRGLQRAVLENTPDGGVRRKAGVMAAVVRGGVVRGGDAITVELPPPPHAPLECV